MAKEYNKSQKRKSTCLLCLNITQPLHLSILHFNMKMCTHSQRYPQRVWAEAWCWGWMASLSVKSIESEFFFYNSFYFHEELRIFTQLNTVDHSWCSRNMTLGSNVGKTPNRKEKLNWAEKKNSIQMIPSTRFHFLVGKIHDTESSGSCMHVAEN